MPAGLPDLIGCVRSRFYGLEVKMPRGIPSAIQLQTIDEIRSAGGHSRVVRSPDEAVRAVEASLAADPIDVIVAIANGHNDPRRLAQSFLDRTEMPQ
jgi:hypothetical protein